MRVPLIPLINLINNDRGIPTLELLFLILTRPTSLLLFNRAIHVIFPSDRCESKALRLSNASSSETFPNRPRATRPFHAPFMQTEPGHDDDSDPERSRGITWYCIIQYDLIRRCKFQKISRRFGDDTAGLRAHTCNDGRAFSTIKSDSSDDSREFAARNRLRSFIARSLLAASSFPPRSGSERSSPFFPFFQPLVPFSGFSEWTIKAPLL